MMTFINRMPPSEKRLAVTAGICLVMALAVIAYLQCSDQLNAMDATMYSLQQEYLAYTELARQAGTVNSAFEQMALQHSSQWTQEEIHDRLRREINRLALRDVPPEGSPIPATSGSANVLVSIPQMPMGSLVDSGEGYRSYQIAFKTEPAPIQNIATFLERLQRSNQALRIDSLEIVRQPQSALATATMKVTRTVIGDVAGPGSGKSTESTSMASAEPATAATTGDFAVAPVAGWIAQNCTIDEQGGNSSNGRFALKARVEGDTGSMARNETLSAGGLYDLRFDAFVTGKARVEVRDAATGTAFDGALALKTDTSAHRYHVQFVVPGSPGQSVSLLAPVFVLEGKGTVLQLKNVSLEKGEGGS